MSSLLRSTREVSLNQGYYIPLADIRTRMLSQSTASDGSPIFSTATWANRPAGAAGVYSTLIAASGAGLLKDMGKTLVSSTRTFRKVQLVVSSVSTFGVAGEVGSTYPGQDFLTGYVELGFEGGGGFTPLAQFGR